MSSVAEFIIEFLARHSHGREMKFDDNIFESGFVNSLMAMQLVTMLEKRFQIVFEDDDLTRENFRTVRAIAELAERRIAAGPREGKQL